MARGGSSGSGQYSAYNKRKSAMAKLKKKISSDTDDFIASMKKK